MYWFQKAKRVAEMMATLFLLLLIGGGFIRLGIWDVYRMSHYLPTWFNLSLIMIGVSSISVYLHSGTAMRTKILDAMNTVLICVSTVITIAFNLVTPYLIYQLLPTGIIPGLLVAGLIYFFDAIPYSHLWSLRVRELYPHKQWAIERVLLRSLRSFRIVSNSRLANTKMLPTEIWLLILEHATQIPFFFDTTCNPETFNLFISRQAYDLSASERTKFENQIRNIRAVCKTWKTLVDRRSMHWLGPRTLPNNVAQRWARVDLAPESGGPSYNPEPHYQVFFDSLASSPEQLKTLNIVVIYQRWYIPNLTVAKLFEDHIIPRSQTLSNVHSLIFDAKIKISEQFLRNIEKSFSYLTFLRLEGQFQGNFGRLTLEQLEILYVNVEEYTSLATNVEASNAAPWWFPRLRHLVLGDEIFKAGQFHLHLIPAPPEQILSLLLLPRTSRPVLRIDASFWGQMISLRFFGIPPTAIKVIERAPMNHPLTHFCIPDAHREWRVDTTLSNQESYRQHISRIVGAFPNLKALTIPPGGVGWAATRYPREWRAMFHVHRARGIIWVDESGHAVDGSRRPAVENERLWIFGCSVMYNFFIGAVLLQASFAASAYLFSLLAVFFSFILETLCTFHWRVHTEKMSLWFEIRAWWILNLWFILLELDTDTTMDGIRIRPKDLVVMIYTLFWIGNGFLQFGDWDLNFIFRYLPYWLGYGIIGLGLTIIAASSLVMYKSLNIAIRTKIRNASGMIAICICVGFGASTNLWILYLASQLLPTGLLSGLLVTAFTYFYDTLPYSHVWNPSVRELYPHKQWRIEKAVLESLHALRVLPTSRLANKNTLPTEIWSMILEEAIQIPYFFDTACSPETFNLFISKQAYGPSASERNKVEARIRNIRAVCKTWISLVDRRAICWLNTQALPSNYSKNWTRVDLELGTTPSQEPSGRLRTFLDSLDSSPKRIVSLNTMVIYQRKNSGNSTPEFFRDRIVPHSEKLLNIHALIFDVGIRITRQFLRNVEGSFSHLSFLRLEGYHPQGEVGDLTLDQLEILYLNVEPLNAPRWWFPRLQHLVLGRKTLKTERFHIGLIPAPSEQLLSLLLLPATQHPVFQADNSFWSQMSSLRFLGVPLGAIEVAESAPIDHPLTHFCLPESHTQWRKYSTLSDPKLQRERIIRIVNALPNLKFLTVPPERKGKLASSYSREWRLIIRTHRLRGVIWLDEDGTPIDGSRRVKEELELILIGGVTYNMVVGDTSTLGEAFVYGGRSPHRRVVDLHANKVDEKLAPGIQRKPTRSKIQDKSETVLIYIIVGIGAIANLGTLIPYSHVWSPSVRELYPHKQWRIERALLKSLHSLRIIPTSRVANRRTLPIEIWSLILADAIQIPYFFDTACSPKTFNLFVSKQAYGPSPSERNRTEAQIRNISAARHMLAQQPGVAKYTFDPSTPQFFEDRIVPHSQTLFNVQSLIFDAKLPITQQFLRNIETSFSHLFFLRLEGYFQSEVGNLTLDQLEILYLNVEPPDSFTWWFPQLRHLVLGDEIFKTEQFHLGLIPAPPEKLLSLLLLSATQHPVLQADSSFWSQMSSLRFLGAPIAAIEVAENAPINHPLAHFCLPEAHIEWRILSTPFDPILQRERIIRIANALPNLKFLTMPLGDEGEQASHYSREWRVIFRTHRLRDIIWINEYGESINGLRRARAKVERGFFLGWLFLIFLYWLWTVYDQ
ncbi:hypothetical protein M408DRAFT_9400 [Serendipita vermifera MAFF 305830]|uniref:Uncharacterized protein n=1 Tax=Serendipita vermifera MAFF 305830 TaxID=933852 RepID=A0A0C3B4W1_SERVB|nr:hypothetical protein M408DRAFT_9400 [Serendipita vermifera MAFF 305830]